jgi:hypothetical protein
MHPGRGLIIAGALALLLNVLLVIFGRGSFLHIVFVFGAVVYIAVPGVVAGVVFWRVRQRGPTVRVLAKLAFAVSAVAASTIISGLVGTAVLARDIANAKRYCESLIPKLEQYRSAHGIYPTDLSALRDRGVPPRLLRDEDYYHSNGLGYSFSFGDPGGMMNGFARDQQSANWEEWD